MMTKSARAVSKLTSGTMGRVVVHKEQSIAVPDFTGVWKLQERSNMDDFLKGAEGLNWALRTAAQRAGQMQVIVQGPDSIQVVTRDIRGNSQIKLPLTGEFVSGGEGDPVIRTAYWQYGQLVVEEHSAASLASSLSGSLGELRKARQQLGESMPALEHPEGALASGGPRVAAIAGAATARCVRSLNKNGQMVLDISKTVEGETYHMKVTFSREQASARSIQNGRLPGLEEGLEGI